jgi:hypothetical protein
LLDQTDEAEHEKEETGAEGTSKQAHILEAPRDKLSKKVRDRFERLSDQLQSLMLDEIKDYTDETASLQETVRHASC